MKNCVIFCAGDFDSLAAPIGPDTIVIAADGGLRHARALGIEPTYVLGDFDSLGYVPAQGEVFPVEKDDTDCMLAIRKALALGCDRILIYGGLDGPRVDHTVANFQALQYVTCHGAQGYLVGKKQIACVIGNSTVDFPPHFSGYLSVFCMGADAAGVCIRGLQYEADDVMLTSAFPLGVSNRFMEKDAAVSVENGTLLLIWEKQNGIP